MDAETTIVVGTVFGMVAKDGYEYTKARGGELLATYKKNPGKLRSDLAVIFGKSSSPEVRRVMEMSDLGLVDVIEKSDKEIRADALNSEEDLRAFRDLIEREIGPAGWLAGLK